MKVDIDGLNDEVKPQLEKAIKKLDEAKGKLTGIDIPDDFYFYSKLSNMPQDISNINENIKNFEKWLDGKILSLGNAESSNKGLIDSILASLFGGDIGNSTAYASGKNVADLEGKELLDTFWYTMFEGEQSDVDVLTMAYYSFYEEIIYNQNPEAEKLLKKVIELKRENSDLNFENADWSWSQSYGNKNVSMYYEYFDNDESYKIPKGTFFHELGHMVFALETGRDFPDGYKDIMNGAKQNVSNNEAVISNFSDSLYINGTEADKVAYERWLKEIQAKGYDSYEEWYYDNVNSINEKLQNWGPKETREYLESMGYRENRDKIYGNWDYNVGVTRLFDEKNYNAEEIVTAMYNADWYENRVFYNLENHGNDGAISDMIDAVYLGEVSDSTEGSFSNIYGHGTSYYNSVRNPEEYAYDELIANFTQIKMSGNEKDLETVKVILGDECYNMLEETYNSFYN